MYSVPSFHAYYRYRTGTYSFRLSLQYQQPLLPPTDIQQPVPQKAKGKAVKRRQISATDSLNYYIARLEKELENVNESTYHTKAEEVLRADARLQKLVQRIMIGELTKDNVPAEALNTNKTMEEQP